MLNSTYSQRTNDDKRPELTIQTAIDSDQVIVTVGPLGGPFQTVYLSPLQANFMGLSMAHMAAEQGGPTMD